MKWVLGKTGWKRINRSLNLGYISRTYPNQKALFIKLSKSCTCQRINGGAWLTSYICLHKNDFSMKKAVYTFIAGILATFLLSSALTAQIPHLIFHAELVGAEQIPTVNTSGRGLITLMYNPERTKVTVTGLMVNIDGDITNVTLNMGKTGETGAVLLDLTPTVIGRRLHAEIDVPDQLLRNLLPNQVYATLSTTAHPSGEIRGQFICETDEDFTGILTGSEAVPVSNSAALGFGGLHFPKGSEDLAYAFSVRDLSSTVTEIGLYKGDPGTVGTLVHDLTPGFFGGLFQGLLEFSDLPPDVLREMREGKYYIVVKTENYPDGEIRGQIGFQGYFTSIAPINSFQQVPNPGSTGFGFSLNKLSPGLDSITTTVSMINLVPTSIDIHIGDPGTVGPLFETLAPSSNPLIFQKKYAINSAQLTDFAQGRFYVNITTSAYPNGEIRGQMKNTLRKGYAFDLCKEQMVPPTNSNGFGVGMASVDQANCYLNYKVIYDKLSGPVNEALICQAPPTMNGNAIYPMPTTSPLIPGIQEIMAAHGVAIELGETYMLLVTNAYPNGEIRGQIVRGFSCPETSAGISPVQKIEEVLVSPNPFRSELSVTFSSETSFDAKIVLYDILGVQTLVYPIQITEGDQVVKMPTAGLPIGYYTMVLETPDRSSGKLLKKLIRQE